MTSKGRGTFGRAGFILAAAGSAVGLGNIWKFPYVTYENQGGSFVLVYLLAVAAIGAPVMLAEIFMGRHTRRNPVGAFIALSEGARGGKAWVAVGWLGFAAGFVILSYYAVVAGWTVYYVGKCLSWSVSGFSPEAAAGLGKTFEGFLASGGSQLSFHAVFMALTMGVVILGVRGGIELFAKVLLPVLFIILVMLVVASVSWPGFADALGFLFHIGPVSWRVVLEAVGQAFFSLSLGMGAMVTYGSYIGSKDSLPRAGLTVVLLDTLIALMACVVMFSIIFSVPEAERDSTFSASMVILFTTLPRMFYALPGGVVLAPAFYLLVAFAALTSTVSLLEVVVAYFVDERRWSRAKAVGIVGGAIFVLGIPAALSLGASAALSSMGIFDKMDYVAANWMLPIGGLLIAVFVGWFVDAAVTRAETEQGHGRFGLHDVWKHWALRFVCPLGIVGVILLLNS
jgi:NSS family neurotransmitter:Na+ symporter